MLKQIIKYSHSYLPWLIILTLFLGIWGIYRYSSSEEVSSPLSHPFKDPLRIAITPNGDSFSKETVISRIQNALQNQYPLRYRNIAGEIETHQALYYSVDELLWLQDMMNGKELAEYLGLQFEVPDIFNLPSISNTLESREVPKELSQDVLSEYAYEYIPKESDIALTEDTSSEMDIRIKNVGKKAWKKDEIFLMTDSPYRYKSPFYVPGQWLGESVITSLPSDVAVGEEVSFSVPLQGTSTGIYSGYNLGLGLKHEETWYSLPGSGIQTVIHVIPTFSSLSFDVPKIKDIPKDTKLPSEDIFVDNNTGIIMMYAYYTGDLQTAYDDISKKLQNISGNDFTLTVFHPTINKGPSTSLSLENAPLVFSGLSLEESQFVVQEMDKKPYVGHIEELSNISPLQESEKIPIIKSLKEFSPKTVSLDNGVLEEMKNNISTAFSRCQKYDVVYKGGLSLVCSSLQQFSQNLGNTDIASLQKDINRKIIRMYGNIQKIPTDLRPMNIEQISDTFKKQYVNGDLYNVYVYPNALIGSSFTPEQFLSEGRKLSESVLLYGFEEKVSFVPLWYIFLLGFLCLLILLGIFSRPIRFTKVKNFLLHLKNIIFNLWNTFKEKRQQKLMHGMKILPDNNFVKNIEMKVQNYKTLLKGMKHKEEKVKDSFTEDLLEKKRMYSYIAVNQSVTDSAVSLELEVGKDMVFEDIEIYMTDNILRVFSKKDIPSSFEKNIEIHQKVDVSGIQAKLSDGILRITLPRVDKEDDNSVPQSFVSDTEEIVPQKKKDILSRLSIDDIIFQTNNTVERPLTSHVDVEKEYILVEIMLEGMKVEDLDIKADESNIYVRSRKAAIIRCKKDIILPKPVLVNSVVSDVTSQSILLKFTPKSLTRRIEVEIEGDDF